MEALIDHFGEAWLMFGAGLLTGLVFGFAAYHARFCLRAATAEVAEGRFGPKLAIWLIAFCTALTLVQGAIWLGVLDVSAARQLAATGSLSGAILGGLMFGAGMILARGCASRLLVLSASGNMRAIVTGLVLTLTAQAALTGVLSPIRDTLAGIWTISGGTARRVVDPEMPLFSWVMLGVLASLVMAMALAALRHVRGSEIIAASAVGGAVFMGWQATYAVSSASFEIVAIQSVTFTGPSTDTLMSLVNRQDYPLTFGLGLVPGVFVGAMVMALLKGEARIQGFDGDVPMERYLIGGVLMGFGAMLAGGCAVGAGMTGGAVFSLTAWVAVLCMWLGAMITHRILIARDTRRAAPA